MSISGEAGPAAHFVGAQPIQAQTLLKTYTLVGQIERIWQGVLRHIEIAASRRQVESELRDVDSASC